jgi:hypothetical protein
MRWRGQLDHDRVARPYDATGQDDSHDAGLSYYRTVFVASEHRSHQARLKVVELGARVAKAGHLDDGIAAQVQPRTRRKAQQVDPAGSHVLPQVPGGDHETGRSQLVMQLGMDQVDLAQVRLDRIAPHT